MSRPICREMRPGEEDAVLALVMRGFDRFVSPDFSEQGVAEFARSARGFVTEHPDGHEITVAESGGDVVGMIDLRDGMHVTLFFVDGDRQRTGVGRALLASALSSHPETTIITVNSAPSAVITYERLGFQAMAPEAEINGIRFVAMRKELPPRT